MQWNNKKPIEVRMEKKVEVNRSCARKSLEMVNICEVHSVWVLWRWRSQSGNFHPLEYCEGWSWSNLGWGWVPWHFLCHDFFFNLYKLFLSASFFYISKRVWRAPNFKWNLNKYPTLHYHITPTRDLFAHISYHISPSTCSNSSSIKSKLPTRLSTEAINDAKANKYNFRVIGTVHREAINLFPIFYSSSETYSTFSNPH